MNKNRLRLLALCCIFAVLLTVPCVPVHDTLTKYVSTINDSRVIYLVSSREMLTGTATLAKGYWAFYMKGRSGGAGEDGSGSDGPGEVKGVFYLSSTQTVTIETNIGAGAAGQSGESGAGGGATIMYKGTARPTSMTSTSWIAIAGGGGGGGDCGSSRSNGGWGGKGGVLTSGLNGSAFQYAAGSNGGGGAPGGKNVNGSGTADVDSNDGNEGTFLQGGKGHDGCSYDAGGGGGGWCGGAGGGSDNGGGGGSSMANNCWQIQSGGLWADAVTVLSTAPSEGAAKLVYIGDLPGDFPGSYTSW
jgi:hypothetical protein